VLKSDVENERCARRFQIPWDQTLRDKGCVPCNSHGPHDGGSTLAAGTAHRHPLCDAADMSGIPSSTRSARAVAGREAFQRGSHSHIWSSLDDLLSLASGVGGGL
jgi:hypothetical protein